LEFWASAEVHQSAFAALDTVRRSVEPFLNAALATSSLAPLPCKLRYVPIVMPTELHARYPARSRLRSKERIYDCAPQLDYEVFVDGQFAEQLREYLRGLALSASHLKQLGASPDQIKEFQRILADALKQIPVDRPDQTRH
jgi:hypothetical protein